MNGRLLQWRSAPRLDPVASGAPTVEELPKHERNSYVLVSTVKLRTLKDREMSSREEREGSHVGSGIQKGEYYP